MVVSSFTYTLEGVIQAEQAARRDRPCPGSHQPERRASRDCFTSVGAYVRRSAISIFRIYSQYEPLARLPRGSGGPRLARSASGRASSSLIEGNGSGHVQSLILGAVLFNRPSWWGAWCYRRPAERHADDDPAHLRACPAGSNLKLGVEPSHYEPAAVVGRPLRRTVLTIRRRSRRGAAAESSGSEPRWRA